MKLISNPSDFESLDIQDEHDRLTRAFLDRGIPQGVPVSGPLDVAEWYHVRSIANFWLAPGKSSLDFAASDILIGLHSLHRAAQNTVASIHFLILGDLHGIRIFLGVSSYPSLVEAGSILVNSFVANLPGLELAPRRDLPGPVGSVPQLGRYLEGEGYFKFVGRVTGIATRKTVPSPDSQDQSPPRKPSGYGEQIDRLIRGMQGVPWGYLVSATPLPDAARQARLDEALRLATRASALIKLSGSITETPKGTVFNPGQPPAQESRQRAFEMLNRDAQLLLDMVDAQIKRLITGRAEGMWSTAVRFFAPDMVTAARAGSLLRGCFGGSASRPEPIRIALEQKDGTISPDQFNTELTCSELAVLTQLPQDEYSGYRVCDYARFDLDAAPLSGDVIPIGEIVDAGHKTGNVFQIRLNDLSKHALVVGITGSGKTSTIFRLLHNLITRKGRSVPFLVIEPAKTEYRRLLGHPAFAGLRVYTLNAERTAPFRLNPFEFDIIDENERTQVQTHIDYLKSVFNAAFVLYAPMPYVLDIALHQIYQERGWNLATGLNDRLEGATRAISGCPAERQLPVFPTLSDLHRKIAEVVEQLGYEERIKMDVIAGLQARLDSLRLGGKGLMLDVPHGIEMSELLAQPTVLELDRIGNDEEKAFVIGLLMARISAFRRLQGNAELRHITVIEEAHRLLKNVETEVGTEEASNKASAVETFANMLSEIRAYGEGIIIAEQIPSKLAPDAIKNTNLKLLHRLLASEDRESVGATINLTEEQSRRAVTLNPTDGEVIAFAEGCDHPFLLNVELLPGVSPQLPKDENIRKRMADLLANTLYEPAPDFDVLVRETDPIARLELGVIARDIARRAEFRTALLTYLHVLLADAELAARLLPLLECTRRIRGESSGPQEPKLFIAICVCAAQDLSYELGRLYGKSYVLQEKLRHDLAALLNLVARNFAPGMKGPQFQSFLTQIKPLATAVVTDWMQITQRPIGPLIGCSPCKQKCTFRLGALELLRIPALTGSVVEAMAAKGRSRHAYWREIAAVFETWAGTMTPMTSGVQTKHALKVCLAAHYAQIHHSNNGDFQVLFVNNVDQA